jgi:ubiquinone/menaquinone biosynthesis C-methylase UbiE
MASTDSVFTGSIPALYDRYLADLLFRPYAADLAARLGDLAAGAVLEVAAGTGLVTEALASALPAAIAITATDLNQAMIDFAAAKPWAAGSQRVAWRQANAMALPFADASFDAVVCQFGVMFFPDRVAAHRETRRVLKPSGRFVFAVWDAIEHSPVEAVVLEAVARRYPTDPPQFLARTPHGYHDVARIRADLAAAGFTQIAIATVTKPSRAASARDAAIGLCQGTPLRAEIEARDPPGSGGGGLAAATDAAAAAVATRFGPGPIEVSTRAHVAVAVS